MMRFLRHSYTAIILGFLYLPIFILIVFSFNASKSRAVWEGFTRLRGLPAPMPVQVRGLGLPAPMPVCLPGILRMTR